jgi:surfeit locus 1 family protein
MSQRPRIQRLLPVAAALGAALVCSLLGQWQLRRLGETNAWIEQMTASLALEPIPVFEALLDPEAFGFRRVVASGSYDLDASILIERQRRDDQSGVRVVTPLRLEDGARTLLVDRGFVPLGAEEELLAREEGAVAATVTGTLVPLQVRELPRLPARPKRRLRWHRVDVSALSLQVDYPLQPALLIRGDDASGVPPLGRTPVPRGRVDHLNYAITWFSIAAIAAAFAVVLAVRGLGTARGARSSGTDREAART